MSAPPRAKSFGSLCICGHRLTSHEGFDGKCRGKSKGMPYQYEAGPCECDQYVTSRP